MHIKYSLKKIRKSYNLQSCLPKHAIEHDKVYEDAWEEKENEWLPYLKNNVSSTVFSYASYTNGMEALTRFSMKNSSTLPSLANKNFNSLRD